MFVPTGWDGISSRFFCGRIRPGRFCRDVSHFEISYLATYGRSRIHIQPQPSDGGVECRPAPASPKSRKLKTVPKLLLVITDMEPLRRPTPMFRPMRVVNRLTGLLGLPIMNDHDELFGFPAGATFARRAIYYCTVRTTVLI